MKQISSRTRRPTAMTTKQQTTTTAEMNSKLATAELFQQRNRETGPLRCVEVRNGRMQEIYEMKDKTGKGKIPKREGI